MTIIYKTDYPGEIVIKKCTVCRFTEICEGSSLFRRLETI